MCWIHQAREIFSINRTPDGTDCEVCHGVFCRAVYIGITQSPFEEVESSVAATLAEFPESMMNYEEFETSATSFREVAGNRQCLQCAFM
jgi:hypothetical protein